MRGCLAYRELDDTLCLTDTAANRLADTRTGKKGRRRVAGYEDVNDATRLCRDPAMRWVVGDRAISTVGLPSCPPWALRHVSAG